MYQMVKRFVESEPNLAKKAVGDTLEAFSGLFWANFSNSSVLYGMMCAKHLNLNRRQKVRLDSFLEIMKYLSSVRELKIDGNVSKERIQLWFDDNAILKQYRKEKIA